ncbi:hypothetical protein DL95DRAFT_418370 [Leptodontidium sp. 2 PMI_412]|nr:hypothetical protein DL95DRAFT_418370 [Leptodontidium sp. 2 PMI_412]
MADIQITYPIPKNMIPEDVKKRVSGHDSDLKIAKSSRRHCNSEYVGKTGVSGKAWQSRPTHHQPQLRSDGETRSKDRRLYHLVTMTMNFFGLPKEIRLQLYSELLVLPEPIVFVAAYGPPSPPLFRSNRNGLCPALLQDRATFHEAHIKNLELIRDTCTSITTLELSVPPDRANDVFDDLPIAAETLDLLDTRLKAIPSLKETVVNFQIYSDEDLSDDRMKKIRDRGWTVEVTKLPKKVWISIDDQVEFDNEEDCEAYNEEWHRRECQRAGAGG